MATPDSSAGGTGSAREEAERLVAAVLARASQGASQAAWMAQGARFAARASGHETTSAGLGLLGDALRGVAKTASGFSEDLHKHAGGTEERRAPAPEAAAARPAEPAAPGTPPKPADPDEPGSTRDAAGTARAADGAARDAAGTARDADGAARDAAGTARDAHGAAWGAHGAVRDEPGHVGGTAGGWATGSAECCVCPVCRAITMVRNPTPEFAEQLATSAGDLAAGVAGLLRAFSTAAADTSSWAGPPTATTTTRTTGASTGWAGGAGTASTGQASTASPAGAGGVSPTGGSSASGGASTAAGTGEKAPHEESGTGWPGVDPWAAATRAGADAAPAGDPWAAATRAGGSGGHPGSSGAPATGDHEREPRDTA
ncbi:hypothetical protein [Catenuloplanes atrovinosus]|uniref:Uncharacterized protein n=1 Tax=Catenuloplanes atrovinosus TaxID=137266 RepID=A0AAE3YTS8_9ACTN|nr:hypothetical protein [Catenuloplanes atrovinosus]